MGGEFNAKTYNSWLLHNRQVPEAHGPEEVKDLWQWSLMGNDVRTWVHIERQILQATLLEGGDIMMYIWNHTAYTRYHKHKSFCWSVISHGLKHIRVAWVGCSEQQMGHLLLWLRLYAENWSLISWSICNNAQEATSFQRGLYTGGHSSMTRLATDRPALLLVAGSSLASHQRVLINSLVIITVLL